MKKKTTKRTISIPDEHLDLLYEAAAKERKTVNKYIVDAAIRVANETNSATR